MSYVFGIHFLVYSLSSISGIATYEKVEESPNLLMSLFCQKIKGNLMQKSNGSYQSYKFWFSMEADVWQLNNI